LPWAADAERIASIPTAARSDGVDHGDHPPITPVKCATEGQCGDSGSWAIYKLVCEHFLASISPDCILDSTEVHLDIAGTNFVARSSRRKGRETTWCDVIGERVEEEGALDLSWVPNGAKCSVAAVDSAQHTTKAPDHLRESDLLGLMERHGVGTDASMATHIANVQKRGYVKLDEQTRHLIPAPLGLAIAHAYALIDPGLVRPTVRAAIENACARVAKGEARKKDVVSKALIVFERKFKRFCKRIDRLPTMLAVAYSKNRDARDSDTGWHQQDYSEEDWRRWAAKKKTDNPDMDFSEEEWLEWLKQKDAGRQKRRMNWHSSDTRDGVQENSCASQASPAEVQWDLAAKATAAISLDDLMRDRSSAELQEEEVFDASGPQNVLRAGARIRIIGLKGSAQLNGQEGTCAHQDTASGRWHIKLANGDTKALKPENLEAVCCSQFRSGMAVLVHSLKSAPQLNGQEGICEQWDPTKGRWTVRLPLGEVKALRPDNLQEVQDDDEAAARAVVRVQGELEALGFGAGYSAPSMTHSPGASKRKPGEDEDENKHSKWTEWRSSRRKWTDDEYQQRRDWHSAKWTRSRGDGEEDAAFHERRPSKRKWGETSDEDSMWKEWNEGNDGRWKGEQQDAQHGHSRPMRHVPPRSQMNAASTKTPSLQSSTTQHSPQHDSRESVDNLQVPQIVLPPAHVTQGSNQQTTRESAPFNPQHVPPPQMVPPPRAWQHSPAYSTQPWPIAGVVQSSTAPAPMAASFYSSHMQQEDVSACVAGYAHHAPSPRERVPPSEWARKGVEPPEESNARHTLAAKPPGIQSMTAAAPPGQVPHWNSNTARVKQSGSQRARLKKRVFRGCDKDGDGYLDKDEMLSLAVLTGFDGSDESWAEEYARLCRECNADRNIGIAQATLLALLDDQSEAGFYCTDKQLEEMSAALESDSDG